VGPRHLAGGARLQNGVGLERLARHVEPSVGWDDLVLRDTTLAGLQHLADRVAHRDRLLDDWRLRRGGRRGEGITALFAGDSGTGKTMAAEVIAGALGLDLYVIDLATVVDKYVGETEKNLERVFAGAEGVNGVLFFDEADALFGKRSEVSDARDRYANIETAYLLQRMESFDGLAILATNLQANLDEAFARRLSLMIEFVQPDVAERRRLWPKCLAAVPVAADVDLDFCASAFRLAGGDIRNIAVTAACFAASDGGVVEMAQLIRAVQVEYRKLGRLCVEAEFGPYHELLQAARL
jgi:SpoVK/Ycf46/Vps4 family AAA+-type ATPase